MPAAHSKVMDKCRCTSSLCGQHYLTSGLRRMSHPAQDTTWSPIMDLVRSKPFLRSFNRTLKSSANLSLPGLHTVK